MQSFRWWFLLILVGCPRANASQLDVPFVPQIRAGCGSAAIAMVIQYWAQRDSSLVGVAMATEDIDRLLPASARGIQGKTLEKYLKGNGFDVFVFDGEASDLKHHLDKGRPVVVCLAPAGAKRPMHYAVVVGLDSASVSLNDGARGKLFHQGLGRFLSDWKESGNWALLAVPRSAR